MTVTTMRPRGRLFARAGVLAAAAATVMTVLGAGAASAADKPLDWKGAFPIIGDQTVKTVVHVDIPAEAKIGQQLKVPFSLDADVGTSAADGLRLVGAKKLGGSIDASVSLKLGDKAIPLQIKMPIPDTEVPAEGTLKFTAKGEVNFTVPQGIQPGEATTSVDPKAVSHVTTDAADPSLAKFDVNLALDPPSQDAVLGKTKVS
ncbi:DUF6801 domain-containing protein [Amycolatopsis sp. CA-230715]|uniref:DUF6801 domain-containing protein n=1 Tax=Amycolatopsis sp. CA-230715 TaxID=2745196 RepID=UPI001C3301FF|nr:DUF6801 domain-containing protein [Amycolatopsis sp. CA-230715]QWF78875.1 hypothetical protein HUW46_02273 [Amycolatopsis sp. CA-230715]